MALVGPQGQQVPGPLGSTPAPGNPPTPATGSVAAPQPTQNQQEQELFDSLFGSQLQGISSATAEQNTGLAQQLGIGGAQQGITDTQLQQQLSDTLKSLGLSGQQLGIQQTQLGQESALQQGQYGITQQQNVLSGQELSDTLKNLQTQYGLSQQQLGLERTQAVQGAASSGVMNTGTLGQELQGINITGAQEASNYLLGQQQNQLGQQQLGLTGQGEALSNTYQTQQIQNALANLGISGQQLGLQGTEAQQSYGTGTQQAANTYAQLANQIGLAQGANTAGEFSQAGNLLDTIFGAGMFTG